MPALDLNDPERGRYVEVLADYRVENALLFNGQGRRNLDEYVLPYGYTQRAVKVKLFAHAASGGRIDKVEEKREEYCHEWEYHWDLWLELGGLVLYFETRFFQDQHPDGDRIFVVNIHPTDSIRWDRWIDTQHRRRASATTCAMCRSDKSLAPTAIHFQKDIRFGDQTYPMDIPDVPVSKCSQCGSIFFDDVSDKKITEALRHEVGLLRPEDIQCRRASLGLSSSALSVKLGVSREEIDQWEQGILLQSADQDASMREYFESAACAGCAAVDRVAEGANWSDTEREHLAGCSSCLQHAIAILRKLSPGDVDMRVRLLSWPARLADRILNVAPLGLQFSEADEYAPPDVIETDDFTLWFRPEERLLHIEHKTGLSGQLVRLGFRHDEGQASTTLGFGLLVPGERYSETIISARIDPAEGAFRGWPEIQLFPTLAPLEKQDALKLAVSFDRLAAHDRPDTERLRREWRTWAEEKCGQNSEGLGDVFDSALLQVLARIAASD